VKPWEALPLKLRILRAERGLTLRRASELSGVRMASISDLERGKRRPHDSTLAKLARAYEVSVAELIYEERS
jgi:transcriptional regulator with XRE-family HTH domain